MKRRSFLPPALFLLCSLLVIAAAAAGGDASDPLVSLSHLQGAFTKTVDSRLDSALTASDAALKARAGSGTPSDTAASAAADTWTERRLKNGTPSAAARASMSCSWPARPRSASPPAPWWT